MNVCYVYVYIYICMIICIYMYVLYIYMYVCRDCRYVPIYIIHYKIEKRVIPQLQGIVTPTYVIHFLDPPIVFPGPLGRPLVRLPDTPNLPWRGRLQCQEIADGTQR